MATTETITVDGRLRNGMDRYVGTAITEASIGVQPGESRQFRLMREGSFVGMVTIARTDVDPNRATDPDSILCNVEGMFFIGDRSLPFAYDGDDDGPVLWEQANEDPDVEDVEIGMLDAGTRWTAGNAPPAKYPVSGAGAASFGLGMKLYAAAYEAKQEWLAANETSTKRERNRAVWREIVKRAEAGEFGRYRSWQARAAMKAEFKTLRQSGLDLLPEGGEETWPRKMPLATEPTARAAHSVRELKLRHKRAKRAEREAERVARKAGGATSPEAASEVKTEASAKAKPTIKARPTLAGVLAGGLAGVNAAYRQGRVIKRSKAKSI